MVAWTLLTSQRCSPHGDHARKLFGVTSFVVRFALLWTIAFPMHSAAESLMDDPHDVVRHVISDLCVDCHMGAGPGPFPLVSDADLARHGPTAVRAVETGVMPPWLPARWSGELRDARQLSAGELAAFQKWKRDGFVVTPSGIPPPVVLADDSTPPTEDRPLEAAVALGWIPNPEDPDALRSFSVPLNNDHPIRIRGWQATRETPTLPVRYNLLVSNSPVAQALDESDPGPGFGRLGDLPDRTSGSIGAIGVDGRFELPEGFAFEIPPNATLVAEALTSGKGRSLAAGAVLRALPARAGARVVRDFCVIPDRSAPSTRIDDRVNVTSEPLHEPLDVVAIVLRPDMRARAVTLRRIDAQGTASPIIEIDHYRAMLDRGYVFATPLQLARGDRIRYEVQYDTTTSARRATPVAVLLTAAPVEATIAAPQSMPLTSPRGGRACDHLGISLVTVLGDSPFRLGRTEVTQRQFLEVLSRNPSLLTDGAEALDRPVDSVSWFDAAEFCNALSTRDGLSLRYELASVERDSSRRITSALVRVNPTGGYRLPSEAQWTQCAFPHSASSHTPLNSVAATERNSWMSPWAHNTSHPVATKDANSLGFHDLAGNVWEWCEDAFVDPASTGPVQRAIRGGAWCDQPAAAAFDFRSGIPAGTVNSPFGFRVAIDGLPQVNP